MKKLIKKLISWLLPNKFILSRVRSESAIAITFDDGPQPIKTEKLLSILRNTNVRATFFISGKEAGEHPELLKKIKDAGHEIGNHGFIHKRISEIGISEYRKGIELTANLIEKYAGAGNSLFRAPYGEINLRIFKLILQANLIYTGWTVDSRDSYVRESIGLIKSIRSREIKGGDILLFHADYDTTIDAMPEIIADLKERGFELVTVSELMDKKTK